MSPVQKSARSKFNKPSLPKPFRDELRAIDNHLAARSEAFDRNLRHLWQQLIPPDVDVVLLAVGGYGRGKLYPHSDIDLCVVHPDELNEFLRLRVQAFVAASWSTGAKMAVSVRTTAALPHDLLADQTLRTSLITLRRVDGSARLESQVRELVRASAWSIDQFLHTKRAEMRERHARFQDSAYTLEPHLKDGPGGLRDLDTLRWVYHFASGAQEFSHLVRGQWLERSEAHTLMRIEREYGVLREKLHTLTKRAEERLLFDHQLALAEQLGFVDQGFGRRAVEQLMQCYYRNVSDVLRLKRVLISRLAESFAPARSIETLSDGFKRIGNLLDHSTLAHFEQRPELWVEAFRLVAKLGLEGLSARLLRLLPKSLMAIDQAQGLGLRRAFFDALNLTDTAGFIRLCAEAGLLSVIVPAFESVRGRMQFDLFHVYCVDEHTLRLLERLRALRTPEPEFAIAASVWDKVRRPELLYLAGLFHDIAKGRGGDHSELGAVDARQWLSSIELPHDAVELVSWLVEMHLLMSTTAQKKDIHDPAVVAHFAVQVIEPERLHLLFLLTVADIRATNPKLWNGWKARLLADLHEQTRFHLRRGASSHPYTELRAAQHRLEAQSMLLGEGAKAAQLETIWADFPVDTFIRLKPDELRWITQATIGHPDQSEPLVAVRRSAGREGYQIFVRAPDQRGLFATLSTALDSAQLSVLGARIATCPSGWSLDTFQALDLREDEDGVARAIEIQIKLKLALSALPLKPRLTKRMATRQQKQFRTALKVALDPPDPRGRQTLSVICSDAPGVLARVALALNQLGLNVHAARIATFGERVEDFFEVSAEPPGSISVDALTQALSEALS
jgi:[protein-PII] uridylyltransferase